MRSASRGDGGRMVADQRFFRIGQFELRPRECRRNRPDRFTGALHDHAPRSGDRSSPRRTSSAWRGRHGRMLPWRPPASATLIRTWPVRARGRPSRVRRIDGGEFRPGIGGAHVDNAHRLKPWPRRLGVEQARGLAALHAAPEFLFRPSTAHAGRGCRPGS